MVERFVSYPDLVGQTITFFEGQHRSTINVIEVKEDGEEEWMIYGHPLGLDAFIMPEWGYVGQLRPINRGYPYHTRNLELVAVHGPAVPLARHTVTSLAQVAWGEPDFFGRKRPWRRMVGMVQGINDVDGYLPNVWEEGGQIRDIRPWSPSLPLHAYNVVGSYCTDGFHRAAFDIDEENPDVNYWGTGEHAYAWMKSSSYWHLYTNTVCTHTRYAQILAKVLEEGKIQQGWVNNLGETGSTWLRAPHCVKGGPSVVSEVSHNPHPPVPTGEPQW